MFSKCSTLYIQLSANVHRLEMENITLFCFSCPVLLYVGL